MPPSCRAACLCLASLLGLGSQVTSPTRAACDGLADIVGTWQSDTSQGVSARSDCAWTPQHSAVVCDQLVSTPAGRHRVTNLYTCSQDGAQYFYYGLNAAGEVMRPVPLHIQGKVWVYGGDQKAPDGATYRTINTFSGSSAASAYTWRRELSRDGKTWKLLAAGRAERVPNA